MSEIYILEPSVYNRISAGEVVENPASIVKELVENAIDAGATSISVEIEEGGIKSISVLDNGCGIEKENLHKVFLPHATSKIRNAEDLETISTLGFRGEALASIASVTIVTIQSRFIQEDIGYKVTYANEKLSEVTPIGMNIGTKIIATNLFYNTPVREKFLKKPSAEERNVTNLMKNFILANPIINFKYIADGKLIYQSNNSLEDSICTVYGHNTLNSLRKVNFKSDNYSITGYVGNKDLFKPNRLSQTLVINGRIIINQAISVIISNAYANKLMTRTYPVFILFINMPFDEVDVNCHPSKLDVRFRDIHKIGSFIYKAVLEAINSESGYLNLDADEEITIDEVKKINKYSKENKNNSQDAANIITEMNKIEDELRNILTNTNKKVDYYSMPDKEDNETDDTQENNLSVNKDQNDEYKSRSNNNHFPFDLDAESLKTGKIESFKASLIDEDYKESGYNSAVIKEYSKNEKRSYKILGQLFDTYILIEKNDNFYLIDQHAVHERNIFNHICESFNGKEIHSQMLLIPYTFEVSSDEKQYIDSLSKFLNQSGFTIETFGEDCFKISSVPCFLNDLDIADFIKNLFEEKFNPEDIKNETLFHDKFAKMACKAAIKGGDKLSNEEINNLLTLSEQGIPTQCPHGRPTILCYTRKDIEKLFRRLL